MHPLDDTIAAIASTPGGAARGIIRISGPMAAGCVDSLLAAESPVELSSLDEPHVSAASLRLDRIAAPLPCEVYFWPQGRSYTGQPLVEIHTLGSPPLLGATLSGLCGRGARIAQPGEFTLRAFLCGRIDLTRAEAVLGVIDAVDSRQLDVALEQLAGGLAGPLHRLRDALVDLLAHLEAGFDFADEDLSFITPEGVEKQLDEAEAIIEELARQMASRDENTETIRAVLIGRPNAGKSSLFNVLAQDAGAIVSEHPGTTRDYLTADLDLDGVKCRLVDTAGIGDVEACVPLPASVPLLACKQCCADDENTACKQAVAPGEAGIALAAQVAAALQARRADVQIICLDASVPLPACTQCWAAGNGTACKQAVAPGGSGIVRLVVLTKIDISSPASINEVPGAIATSSLTGAGIADLREALRDAVLAATTGGTDVVAGTALRCRESLRQAGDSLQRARRIVADRGGEELAAAEIHVALNELGKVVGAVYADDVLERIFSRFCIGK